MHTESQATETNLDPRAARIREHLAAGETQERLSRQIGVSQAALNQWLSGKYKGNSEAVAAKVGTYLRALDESRSKREAVVSDPAYVETPTAQRIWPTLRYCQLRGGMVVIAGAAGVGKSTTVAEYASLYPNVWRVTATEASGAVGATLLNTAEAMGMTVVSRKKSDLERAIVEKIVRSGGLLVYDEAQYLETATLYELAGLRERCIRPGEIPPGIVLMGNPQIWSRIKGGYEQLTSRFGAPVILTRPTVGDLDACIDAWARHLEISEVHPETRAFLRSVGTRAGAIRNISETYRYAAFLASGADVAIDLQLLRDAWGSIGEAR